MKSKIVISLLWGLTILASFPGMCLAERHAGIVVWKLQANKGVDETDVNLISNFVTNQVAKYSGNKVVSEADVQTILRGEETRQKCGVEDTSCMAEIGAALGVPEAVSGDIGKIGDYWMLNLRRINVRTAEVIGRSSRNIKGDVNILIESLPGAVAELFGLKAGESPKAVKIPTKGTLFVTSKPEKTSVWINGRKTGKTPLKEDLKTGQYKILLKRRGYEKNEKDVRVLPGETTKVAYTLKRLPPGVLHVTTEPSGATLWINGKEQGITPFERDAAPDSYSLKLKMEGYETIEDRAIVNSNEETHLHLFLERDYPINPYKKYGYVTFFSGLGLVAFGGLATWQAKVAANDYKSGDWGAKDRNSGWTAGMGLGYGVGGALMVTGIVLFALSPGDETWWKKHSASVGLAMDEDGKMVTLGGRW